MLMVLCCTHALQPVFEGCKKGIDTVLDVTWAVDTWKTVPKS